MPHRFAEILELHPRTGRTLLGFGGALLLPVATALHLADLSLSWKVAAVVMVLGGLARGCWRLRPGGGESVWRAVALADGSWWLEAPTGQPVTARLVRSWGEARGPVIGLEWRCADGTSRRAWILRQDLPSRTWRHLRVRLALA